MTDPSKSVHLTGGYEPSEALVEAVCERYSYSWADKTVHDQNDMRQNASDWIALVAEILADPAHADDLRAFADATMDTVTMAGQELGTYTISNEDSGIGCIFEPDDNLYRVRIYS